MNHPALKDGWGWTDQHELVGCRCRVTPKHHRRGNGRCWHVHIEQVFLANHKPAAVWVASEGIMFGQPRQAMMKDVFDIKKPRAKS